MAYDETLVQAEALSVQIKHIVIADGQTALVYDGDGNVIINADGPWDATVPAEYTVGIGTHDEVAQAVIDNDLSLTDGTIDGSDDPQAASLATSVDSLRSQMRQTQTFAPAQPQANQTAKDV